MIRVLDRLVARTFLTLFVVALMASPVLFIVGHFTENVDTFVDRGLTGTEIAQAYLYQLPLFIQWSFPIAALVAAVFTVHGMTTNREVVAAKAGGISFFRLVRPVFVLGVLLTGVALVLSDVAPVGQRISAQILRDEDPRRSWRADFVYQSEDGVTWQVERLTVADGRMSDVVLERPATPERPGLHITADAADYEDDSGWTFARGYVRTMLPDSSQRAFQFERLQVAGLEERPDELLEVPREAEEMTYAEIDRQAKIIQRTGGDANELLVKREQKISISVATLVVILLGVPLATSNRRGGRAFGIGVALMVVLLFILMMKVSGAMGEAGALSPFLAAWLPNLLFLAAAALLMTRVRT